MESLKENMCAIQVPFCCGNNKENPCVYFTKRKGNNPDCKYQDIFFCHSKVAQVNRLILKLKEYGIDGICDCGKRKDTQTEKK